LKKWIALLLLAGLAACAQYTFHSPYRRFQNEKFVVFQKGTGTRAMAQELVDAGVIRDSWPFLVVRALHPRAVLQAGEYRFDHAASVSEVFNRLAHGDVFYFNFTVPEGSNIFDIARLLESEGIMPGEDFLQAAKTSEGFLFPSTYRLTHSTTAAALTQMMTAQFHKEWAKLMPDPATDVVKVVTLASLIEKETGVPAERPLIAGVFEKRLKIGMPLGCDPTVIYAALLQNRYHGVIHRSDLDSKHPYNTYQHTGLPPGPIANPGLSSLAAALHPAETQYLYFVAKPGGDGHVFSSNLAAHDKAVGNYRHARKTR